MYIMGTNKWDIDIPKDMLVEQALQFAAEVKANGIAELREFYLAHDQQVLWCTWETENPEGLQEAFTEMNLQSGLISELTPVEDMFPK
jgi:hypothetical protein